MPIPCTTNTVHPRVRGEQKSLVIIDESQNGSSPRARGAAMLSVQYVMMARFIPACAGSRSGP